MENLIYFVKVSLYWALFFTFYMLFLRQHTFFVWNRIYLIAALLLSFLLPFVIYPASAPEMPVVYQVASPEFITSVTRTEQVSVFSRTYFLWCMYLAGALFMGARFYRNVRQLIGFLQEGELIDLEDCKIVLINSNDVGSFSFLKWIVVNRTDYENHFDAILRHEMVHMQQKHSVDILFIELMKILFWFNPILIFYKRSLQEVHEFLADAEAPNKENYAAFLVSYALNTPIASLTNHFFKPSQIKSRIRMIYKNRSSKWLISSYAAVMLVIGIVSLFVAGCEQENGFTKNESNASGDATHTITVTGRIVDSDKKGIAGAVVTSGEHTGAVTDYDGNYTIQTPVNSTLKLSGNGFQSLAVKIANQESMYAVLAPAGNAALKSYAYLSESTAVDGNSAQVPKSINTVAEAHKIFTVVEEQPEFPGGIKAMYKFLGGHIQYPEAAVKANISGRVFLSFVVTETGETEDILVLKGIGYGCDSEAIRVLKAFPRWKPGKQNGVPVNVRYNLPINFELEDKRQGKVSDNKKPAVNPSIDKVSDIAFWRDIAVGAQ